MHLVLRIYTRKDIHIMHSMQKIHRKSIGFLYRCVSSVKQESV